MTGSTVHAPIRLVLLVRCVTRLGTVKPVPIFQQAAEAASIGGRVAWGGSKCSSRASLRFSSASSSVAPWLAMSISRHWDTYQLPSRQTVAANGRFMALLFHTKVGIRSFRERSVPSGWMIMFWTGFRKQVDDAGGGSYQNLINQALRAYIERSQERSKLSCEGWCGKNCGGRV